jgi:hypothetical protein
MKLAHMQSRAGRRGGKRFHNGPLIVHNGRTFGEGTYDSTGRNRRRAEPNRASRRHGGAATSFHAHATTGVPKWARR